MKLYFKVLRRNEELPERLPPDGRELGPISPIRCGPYIPARRVVRRRGGGCAGWAC